MMEGPMPKTRAILELGSGNDLHGSDYTKAALRAVQERCTTLRCRSFGR
jgi:hypothetical protein